MKLSELKRYCMIPVYKILNEIHSLHDKTHKPFNELTHKSIFKMTNKNHLNINNLSIPFFVENVKKKPNVKKY